MNDETQKTSWWKRLSGGLKRTSSQLGTAITGLLTKRKLDASTLEELENELIRADFGIDVADRTIAALRREIIMAARAHWFEDDASASGSEDKPQAEEAADAESPE